MSLDTYLMFVGTCIIMTFVPGPSMAYLLARSIAQGRKFGIISLLGLITGSIVHLVAALVGLTAIFTRSTTALTVVKWLGVTYLIYIGVLAFRSSGGSFTFNTENKNIQIKDSRAIFWQGFFTELLNPKIAIFYLAFLPQFISSEGMHPTLQLLILGITVNVVGCLGGMLLVYFAAKVTKKFRSNGGLTLQLNLASRVMGCLFFALAIRLVIEQVF